MSAEYLRETAALMRDVAARTASQTVTPVRVDGVWLNSRFFITIEPAVALAVADWLDRCVRLLADGRSCYGPEVEAALAVARAYRGES